MVSYISNSLTLVKNFFNYVLDILFPIQCLGCGREGAWICKECFENISLNIESVCPFCGKSSPFGRVCFSCQGKYYLKGVMVASTYDNKILKNMIQAFKYNFVRSLAKPLGQILINFLEETRKINFSSEDVGILQNPQGVLLIPIPLHRKRFLERDFNQAELLAIEVANRFGFKLSSDILKRLRYTPPQVKLKREAREENIKRAFSCVAPEAVKGKKILLLDDVFTTGATVNECAQVLKKAGAREIWGLVLAKA